MATYVEHLQPEFPVNYCHLVSVSVDHKVDTNKMRAALGADWLFLMDSDRQLLHELEMADSTDKAHGEIYIPYSFILDHDLTIYRIYNGWWYLGRPTPEEIRMDLRALMSRRPDWVYGQGPDT